MASAAVQAAAARLGGGRAALALELVGFDGELGAAMRYVFGNAFVCQARMCRTAFWHFMDSTCLMCARMSDHRCRSSYLPWGACQQP